MQQQLRRPFGRSRCNNTSAPGDQTTSSSNVSAVCFYERVLQAPAPAPTPTKQQQQQHTQHAACHKQLLIAVCNRRQIAKSEIGAGAGWLNMSLGLGLHCSARYTWPNHVHIVWHSQAKNRATFVLVKVPCSLAAAAVAA